MFTLEQHSNIISKIGIRTFTVEKMDNLFSTLDSMQIGGEIPLILTGLNAWLKIKNAFGCIYFVEQRLVYRNKISPDINSF